MSASVPLRESLWSRWGETFRPFELSTAAIAPAFARLLDAYSEPSRFYHTLQHISEVLEVVDQFRGAAQLVAVELAGWFHDVVYNPRASDNEERSAAWAGETLRQLSLPEEAVRRTEQLILLTKTHRTPNDDTPAAILLDADLAILGSPVQRYSEYAKAIRREYAWVPQSDYRAGRMCVLEAFLGRHRIFLTERLFAAYEAQARDNLRAEIESLIHQS